MNLSNIFNKEIALVGITIVGSVAGCIYCTVLLVGYIGWRNQDKIKQTFSQSANRLARGNFV